MLNRVAALLACAFVLSPCRAQSPVIDVSALASRLDRLEEENRKLIEEIKGLRQDLAAYTHATPAGPPLEERVAVQEQHTEDLAQSKVEASQKMPVSLTGMLLFNAFANGKYSGGQQDPVLALPTPAHANSGATVRQTVLGLKFNGPVLPWGGKAEGNVYMDFWGGSSDPAGHYFRLRIATIDLKWKNTTVSLGQDKPLISFREPDSLAQVGVSPLTAAGNLWDWQPQVRVERRVALTDTSGLRLQGSIYMTNEGETNVPAEYASTQEQSRPGYEGRFEFFHESGDRAFSIAPGFHFSDSHVAETTVPSRIASLDWRIAPNNFFSFKGTWFRGRNIAPLGSLDQGYIIHDVRSVTAVHSQGGWAQVSFTPAKKFNINLYSGVENDRASDLAGTGITRNFVYAGNLIYHLAPNVLAGFEASQARTQFSVLGLRLNNHYDLALAYLF